MDVEYAIEECPDAYASVLLRNEQDYSISHRELFIGNKIFNLTYMSLTDRWRSNCGYVVIIYNGVTTYNDYNHLAFTNKVGTHITSPIFAFDYIDIPVRTSQYPDGCPQRFYVDFNEAPGIPEEVIIKDYGNSRDGEVVNFSDIISPKNIAKEIENRLKSEKK